MGRKHQHEDHVNHEAWAIPYGDLVTLLLAFFVVMYAISSINEGKYRMASDSLSAAFGGAPRTITPIQLGATQLRGSAFDRPSVATAAAKTGPTSVSPVTTVRVRQVLDLPTFGRGEQAKAAIAAAVAATRGIGGSHQQLTTLGEKIQKALAELVQQKLVTVRRGRNFLEVEIQSDILFASGVAAPSPLATSTVRKLAAVLRDSPNAVRVEGYTDDRPIRTPQYPSNWELSAARAASVVHVLVGEGVDSGRLAVVGFGEHQPVADNLTVAGRNSNRRVLLVILAAPQGPDTLPEPGPAIADIPAHAAQPATRTSAGAARNVAPNPIATGTHRARTASDMAVRIAAGASAAVAGPTAPAPGSG
jgi:chemotaxis protein MotB